jgi:hypothetical protein
VRPPLAALGYRDPSLSPESRKSLRQSERINTRLERRAQARGLKIPDEEETGIWGNFLEFLDNLNRPQAAAFNIVQGMAQGLPMQEVARNAIQGFTFEERVRFSDLLETAGVVDHSSKIGKVLGFAGDVVLDPINIVPGYVIVAPLKLAGRTAKRIKVLNAALEAAGASEPVRTLQRVFISSTGNALLDATKKLSVSFARVEETELFKKIATLDRTYRRPLGKLYERVPHLAERPEKLATIKDSTGREISIENYETLVKATDEFKGIIRSIEDLEKAHGIKVPQLSDRIHLEMLKLEKKQAKTFAKRQKKILRSGAKRISQLEKETRGVLETTPLAIKSDFVSYITGRLPLELETRAVNRPGVQGFVSEETGKLKFDLEGMKRRASKFVRGNVDRELSRLDNEVEQLAKRGQWVEFKFPKQSLFDPVSGKPVSPATLARMDENIITMMERLREGRFAATEKSVVGTGKRVRSRRALVQSLGTSIPSGTVKKRLREAIDAYARGEVSEKNLHRWLNLWTGPGAVELKHLPSIVSQIKSRRSLIEKLVGLKGAATEALPEITDAIVEGTYKADEILELFDPEMLRKTGLGAYVRELGKRWDQVDEALKGPGLKAVRRKVSGLPPLFPLQAAARVAIERREFSFATLDELGPFVSDLMKKYVQGDFELDEVLEVFGERGKPGVATLRKALKKIDANQTLIQKIEHLSGERLVSASLALQKRYSPRLQELRALKARLPDYVPHILSSEAIERIVRSGTNVARRLHTEQHASLLWRRFSEKGVRPLDFEEVDAILKSGNLASVRGTPLFKAESFKETFLRKLRGTPQELAPLFSVDPKTILATRALRAAKAVGGADFLDNAARIFGERLNPAVVRQQARVAARPGGQQTLLTGLGKGKIRSSQDRIRDWLFPPEIANEIDRVYTTAYGNEESINRLLGAWDTMTNYWKIWTLGVFPAYHSRNIIGNFWNMHLGGMFEAANLRESLQSMEKAGQLQRWGAQGNTEALSRMRWRLSTGADIDGNELLRMLPRYGIIDEGFYAVESGGRFLGDPTANLGDLPFVRSYLGKPILPSGAEVKEFAARAIGKRGVRESLVGSEGAFTRTGVLVGRAAENYMKSAFFIFQLEHRGKAPAEAMEEVAKYLFQYRDITQSEQVIKRLFPFYTWTRKNLPLQLEQLARQPHKFSRIPEFGQVVQTTGAFGVLGEGIEDTDLPPEEDISKWIRESSPVPVRRRNDGTLEFLLFRNWLPATDIDEVLSLERMNRTAFSMLHPLPKVFLENTFGKNIYFDSDLTKKGEFLGMELDGTTINILRTMRFLNELDAMDPFGAFRKTRDVSTPVARAMRFMTGLRSHIASPEKERLRRVSARREDLQEAFARDRRVRRLAQLKAQEVTGASR